MIGGFTKSTPQHRPTRRGGAVRQSGDAAARRRGDAETRRRGDAVRRRRAAAPYGGAVAGRRGLRQWSDSAFEADGGGWGCRPVLSGTDRRGESRRVGCALSAWSFTAVREACGHVCCAVGERRWSAEYAVTCWTS